MGFECNDDVGVDNVEGGEDGHSGNERKCFGSGSCSICLETVTDNGDRSWVKLQCGHEFHLDCIGSAFNVKGAMQCPNCRKFENGQWLYANGSHSFPELSRDNWAHDEEILDLSYSESVYEDDRTEQLSQENAELWSKLASIEERMEEMMRSLEERIRPMEEKMRSMEALMQMLLRASHDMMAVFSVALGQMAAQRDIHQGVDPGCIVGGWGAARFYPLSHGSYPVMSGFYPLSFGPNLWMPGFHIPPLGSYQWMTGSQQQAQATFYQPPSGLSGPPPGSNLVIPGCYPPSSGLYLGMLGSHIPPPGSYQWMTGFQQQPQVTFYQPSLRLHTTHEYGRKAAYIPQMPRMSQVSNTQGTPRGHSAEGEQQT